MAWKKRATPNGKMSRGRLLFLLSNLAFASLAVIYVAVPSLWQWHSEAAIVQAPERAADEQHKVTATAAPAELVQQLTSLPATPPRQAPPIVTYHNISNTPGPYTVTPQAFADQMALLSAAGWHTLTAAELVSWIHGATLPSHSVLITFDDGVRGVWQYADPVLARYQFHAVAFVITAFPGTHGKYYMTWSELQRMQRSGRWDIESHTSDEHLIIQVDASGRQDGMLNNLLYDPKTGKHESLTSYQERIRSDLRLSKDQLVNHGFPSPQLFAYPYSAYSSSTEVTAVLRSTIGSLFATSMLDGASAKPTTPTLLKQGYLQRVDIMSSTTLRDFVSNVRDSSRALTGKEE